MQFIDDVRPTGIIKGDVDLNCHSFCFLMNPLASSSEANCNEDEYSTVHRWRLAGNGSSLTTMLSSVDSYDGTICDISWSMARVE